MIHANRTVNLVQSSSPRSIRSSPPICAASEETTVMPRPLHAAGSKPSGRAGPPLHADKACPLSVCASLTATWPLPCLIAFVINSFTMRPRGVRWWLQLQIDRFDNDGPVRALFRQRHRCMIATEFVEIWLEFDGRGIVDGMEMLVEVHNRPDAVGCPRPSATRRLHRLLADLAVTAGRRSPAGCSIPCGGIPDTKGPVAE